MLEKVIYGLITAISPESMSMSSQSILRTLITLVTVLSVHAVYFSEQILIPNLSNTAASSKLLAFQRYKCQESFSVRAVMFRPQQ